MTLFQILILAAIGGLLTLFIVACLALIFASSRRLEEWDDAAAKKLFDAHRNDIERWWM